MNIRWLVVAGALLGVVAVDPALAKARKGKLQCVEGPFQFSWQRFLSSPTPRPNGCAPPVYAYGRYVGQDPDPRIRFELLRNPSTGYTVDLQ